MSWSPAQVIRRLFSSEEGAADRLLPRWLFLRGLGLIYFSAFYSLAFQIKGLIGPDGILPAAEYLREVSKLGPVRYWYAPTLLWLSSGTHMLVAICWIGMLAALLLVLNIWPRAVLVVCFVCFLSFVSAAQDCSGFTAMDEYYQNGPLPTWIGWYVQHLPHKVHAFATGATLVLELGLVWMFLLPRPWRIACFLIVTAWQIPVILTANYTFLNYLVLLLGVLLLDDRFLVRWLPTWVLRPIDESLLVDAPASESTTTDVVPSKALKHHQAIKLAIASVIQSWIFYATTLQMLWIPFDPFRIANRYGLFAVMTRGRYEIEFQGSNDGQTWTAYPFRYKPQNPARAPGIYAPYQPRFEWNLWFASLGGWRDNMFVVSAEERLLANNQDVLSLLSGNPFGGSAPKFVRAVIWQYWFTSLEEKRKTGMWWRREDLGLYAPTLTRMPDGKLGVVEWPQQSRPRF